MVNRFCVIRLFSLVSILFSIVFVNAQNENVTIVDSYKAVIQDADKIEDKPSGWDTVVPTIDMKYDFISKPIFKSFVPTGFNSGEYIYPDMLKHPNNCLRFGMGNYLNINGEAYLFQPFSKSTGIGLDFRHFSSVGGIKNLAPNGFSSNFVDLYVKSVLSSVTLNASIKYDRNMVHFYGFNPDFYGVPDITGDSIKQVYNSFGGYVSIGNTQLAGKGGFNYNVSLGYDYLYDRFSSAEGKFDINAKFAKNVNWFSGSQKIGAEVNFMLGHNLSDFYFNGVSTLTQIHPFFKIDYEMLRFNVGLNLAISSDHISIYNEPTRNNVSFYINPKVELGFVPLGKLLYVYLGARGDENRVDLHQLSKSNPFIETRSLEYRFENKVVDGYAGFRINFSKWFELGVEGGYALIKNMPLFVNDIYAEFNNKFTVIYDNATLGYGKAYLAFDMNGDYKAKAAVSYNYYNLDNQLHAWQRPNLHAEIGGDVKIYRGLRANVLFSLSGSTYAKGYIGINGDEFSMRKINAYGDLSLGATYKLNKWLSFFVDFNNVLGKKYEFWNGYYSQSFNFLAGAVFSF